MKMFRSKKPSQGSAPMVEISTGGLGDKILAVWMKDLLLKAKLKESFCQALVEDNLPVLMVFPTLGLQ